MDRRELRELNEGFGESLSRAFELAFTPTLFALFGWWIDGKAGTRPLFTIVLFAFTIGYLAWKMYVVYDADMKEHESRLFRPRSRAEDET